MNDQEIRALILASLQHSKFKWRTPRGISKETKVPIQQVMKFLQKSRDIRKSRKPSKHGELLFTLDERYQREKGLLDKIVSKITNRD